jgi:hypothetical protein
LVSIKGSCCRVWLGLLLPRRRLAPPSPERLEEKGRPAGSNFLQAGGGPAWQGPPAFVGYLDRHLGEQIESISVYYR